MSVFKGRVKIAIEEPITWESSKIDFIELDFSKARGNTLINAEREVFGSGDQGGFMGGAVKTFSDEYCARLASELSGVHYNAFMQLYAHDFHTVTQTVAAYLRNQNPQEFYDAVISDDDDDENEEDFTTPPLEGME